MDEKLAAQAADSVFAEVDLSDEEELEDDVDSVLVEEESELEEVLDEDDESLSLELLEVAGTLPLDPLRLSLR